MATVPPLRIQVLNEAPINPAGKYVLYWMIANRRVHWNFSLDEALEWSRRFNKPLLVFEALRSGYPWASDRIHRFIMEGMEDNASHLARAGVAYYPYVEPVPGEGKGLLQALGGQACLVITDHFPNFFLPRMVESAARKIPVRLIQVDSNGLLPLRASDRSFPTAYAFRRHLQKNLRDHLHDFPRSNPLLRLGLPILKSLPPSIIRKWPLVSSDLLRQNDRVLSKLPIDHSVREGKIRGGAKTARSVWRQFLKYGLSAYQERRDEPEADATSGLSPYLHFGHISPHQVFQELMESEGWTPDRLPNRATGRRGWWGVSESAEIFLDQVITWRELGYNMCFQRSDYDQYESLPAWAMKTLSEHAGDPRPYLYSPDQFESGRSHDPLWNAAQMQLVREGRLHNYLRMLWGKKILEWSAGPREALQIMIALNNKYALDGRDPSSYSGIFWVLGRYDRPWGPERAIFGKIRYMSSANTARKIRVSQFIEKYRP